MLSRSIAAGAAAALTLAGIVSSPANAAVANLTECKFGVNQVFDVQWNPPVELGKNLEISDVTYPYGNAISPPQLTKKKWSGGDYVQFVPSETNPGSYGLEMFTSSGVSKGLLDTYGTFAGLGDDFIFYLGGGSWGTVITTGEGFAYGSSASLVVTNASPTDADAFAYTNCVAEPLGVGESREDVGGGGGGGSSAALALNLKVDVGEIIAGKKVDYSGEGLKSESRYQLELHSKVYQLGEGVTDADGNFSATVKLPAGIEPGPHEIVLKGIDPDGNRVTRTAWIYVGETGILLAKSMTGPISEADMLALTGVDGDAMAAFASLALLAVGAGVIFVARRRRHSV